MNTLSSRTLTVLLGAVIAGLLLLPSSAEAAHGKCTFNPSHFGPQVLKLNKKWDGKNKPMKAKHVQTMLRQTWRAFGYGPKKAKLYAKRNLKQARQESGLRPGVVSKVRNGKNRAKGLFQFTPATFTHWSIKGYGGLGAPLASIIAAVNAQVNAKKIQKAYGKGRILNGNGGWAPIGGKNHCR